MSEGKTMRLNKVLRELNISLDRAVEYLAKNGHEIDSRPTTKISSDIYQVLQDGFEKDANKKAASKEVGEEKRKEKEAIRLEVEAKLEKKRAEEAKKEDVLRAKADKLEFKTVGKIDIDNLGNKPADKTEKVQEVPKAQEAEKVRGAIFNGVDGSFYSDIPPFSARSFMYRIKAPYKKQNIKVLDCQIDANSTLKTLKFEINPAFPERRFNLQVLYGRTLYNLQQSKENDRTILELHQSGTPLSAWQPMLESDSAYSRRYGYLDEEKDIRLIYDFVYGRLVMKQLNLLRPNQLRNYQGDKTRVKLFLYSEIPEEFKLKSNVQGVQQGRVLFVYDLPLPEIKNDTDNE